MKQYIILLLLLLFHFCNAQDFKTLEKYRICALEKAYLEDFKGSITCLNQLLAIAPKDSSAYNDRGLTKEILHDYKGAIEDFNKQLAIDSTFADTYFFKAQVYSKASKHDLAILNYSKSLQYETDNSDAYFFRGILYYEKNDIQKAQNDFDTALEKRKDNDAVYGFLAIDNIKKNNFSEADKMANKGLFYNENCSNCLYSKFSIENQNNTNTAFEYLFKAFLSYTDNTIVRIFYANNYSKNTLHYFNEFFVKKESKCKTAEDFIALGKLSMWFNDYKKARVCFEKSYSLKPNYISAYCAGICLYKLKNDKEAMRFLNLSLALKPNFEETKLVKTKVLIQQKKYKTALNYVTELIERNPYNPDYLALKGSVFDLLKNKKEAKKHLQLAKNKTL